MRPKASKVEPFDVVIVGAGLAGLATALALYQRDATLHIAIVSPELHQQDRALGFGSNQPAIASHPHFSKDHNLLSQWTSFCLPENERVLSAAYAINPEIAPARGRWLIAQSLESAKDLQARINVFNEQVELQFHAFWKSNVGKFGALWLPSAWAISPLKLETLWRWQLHQLRCVFVSGYGLSISEDSQITLRYKNDVCEDTVRAKKIVICSPAAIHDLIKLDETALPVNQYLPLVRWPGQSQIEVSTNRSALFGCTTVQEASYAIALGNNEWLVRDEAKTAVKPFRGDRWHCPDRLPFLGPMFDARRVCEQAVAFIKNDLLPIPVVRNIYLNSAHGTRGLLSGIAGAAVVADMLLGVNTSLSQTLSNALNPNRYVRRALRSHFANLQSNNELH